MNTNNLLGYSQASREYGFSKRHLERLVREGRIRHIKLSPGRPGRVLFRRSDIDAFLDACTVEAAS